MAWNDAPPTADDLGTTADWTKAPPTPEELNSTSKSVAGFGRNLAGEAKSTFNDLGMLGEKFFEHPVDTTAAVVKNLPSAAVNEGKRIGVGELLTGHPINAVEKLGNAMYEKPIATVGDLMAGYGAVKGVAGLAGSALKSAAPAVAEEAASVAPKVAETAAAEAAPEVVGNAVGNTVTKPLPIASNDFQPTIIGRRATDLPEGAPATPPPSTPPPTPPSTPPSGVPFADEAQQALQKAKEVGNYIGKHYEGFAKQPGRVSDIADFIQEKSQMMANQQLGATPLQARQVGHEGMRAIGQYAIDHDIVTPTNGLRGMRAQNLKLLNEAGQKLSAFRKEADALRDPLVNPVDVLQEVKSRLDAKYARGAYSGQQGQYAKAIEDIEDAKPTFEGFSEVATKLNKVANKAARLQQPHQPFTDVANAISDINNDRIKALLGTEKAAQYEGALRDFGVNKKISAMLERKAAGEVKRLGPGSLTSNLTQKLLDEVGYKVGAKAANKMSSAVLKNPSISKSLPSLFKEFINQVDEVVPGGEGLAHGGIVDNELDDFLVTKYSPKEKR